MIKSFEPERSDSLEREHRNMDFSNGLSSPGRLNTSGRTTIVKRSRAESFHTRQFIRSCTIMSGYSSTLRAAVIVLASDIVLWS